MVRRGILKMDAASFSQPFKNMATFITRIELHYAQSEDYDNLHKAMERAGFSRTIPASDGKRYHLPTAEYWTEGPLQLKTVFETAKAAAATVGRAFNIITSETTGSMFNLPAAT